MSLIAPRASIIITASTLGLQTFNTMGLSLVSPNGTPLATYGKVPSVQPVAVVPASSQGIVLGATTDSVVADTQSDAVVATTPVKKSNHTKQIFFGIAALVVITLAILLERFMKRRED